ncbi:MAG TPA: metal ABC transporter ATP-binding protein [Clostridiales bacterium]|nr:metal ABC transporter ATP-binding protein [Clostridiales bacterium]
MEDIIKVNDLYFSYGTHPVLRRLDFYLRQGEFVAILGSNGSGKSTLLKILLGQLQADQGCIELFGQDIKRFKDYNRIGYVAQNSISLCSNFPAKVIEIVGLGLYGSPFKNKKQQALQALEAVGMQDYAHSLIGKLSGGQKQRVMLAKALASNCDLLILDEPTTGVDSQTTEHIYQILKDKTTQQGKTVLIVTHDQECAARYCSRILCLGAGSLLYLTKEQVLLEQKYKHKHTETEDGNGDI